MTKLSQDFRYGLRVLRKNPGFAIVAILVLGLGHRGQHGNFQRSQYSIASAVAV